MKVDVWCQTDRGLKREKNEDSFLVDRDLGLFLVADGMGGHKGGAMASRLAVEVVHKEVLAALESDRRLDPGAVIRAAFRRASEVIFDCSHNEHQELMGMGTTLVGAWLHENRLYIGNVGDSRSYLFSDQKLWQITEDHSLVQEQMKVGNLTESEANAHVSKNIITRSIGYERFVECDLFIRPVQPGEAYIFCSDGLSGMVSDEDLIEICNRSLPSEWVPLMIDAAKQGGGDDNITVLIVSVRE